jgi:exopolysaccharide biosynthesis polyprenyl glycosylphosphotransferase
MPIGAAPPETYGATMSVDSQLNTTAFSRGEDWSATSPGARWYRYENLTKRIMDVVLSVIGGTALIPIFLVIALAIKRDSPGPVLHIQTRIGLNGRRFRFYKFRSMYMDAEARRADLLEQNEASGPVFKMRNDPRVTRVGQFLRRSSLDELPQLLNVIRGDMSLVGPRPPLPREVERYRPSDRERLAVRPGLTCLWQVRGRSTVDFDTWMEYDREYISRMSVWLDLALLFRTVWVVVTAEGAY